MTHLLLHFIVPAGVARFVFKDHWVRAWLIMSATIVVDLDHLLATPIYDPNRCSISFHPLHSHWAIVAYGIMTIVPQSRILGIGLLIHMALDWIDCF